MKKILLLTAVIVFIGANIFYALDESTENATLTSVFRTANAWPEDPEPWPYQIEIQGVGCFFYPPGGGQIFTGKFATDCMDNYVVITTCTPIGCDEL